MTSSQHPTPPTGPALVAGPARARRAHRRASTAWLCAALSVVATATVVSPASPANAAAPIDLGSAATFGVLGGTTVANTATALDTLVRGDLGANTAPTGFQPDAVTGTIYTAADPEYQDALEDLNAAYGAINGIGPVDVDGTLDGDPNGVTVTPGTYTAAAAVSLPAAGTVTLDGGVPDGLSDGVFIFQINGALTLGASASIVLIGGAQASNVFWQIDAAADFGADASMVGTFMAGAAFGVGAGAVINGRVMSLTTVALNDNVIYAASPTITIYGGNERTVTDSDVTISGTSDADEGTPVEVTFDGDVVVPPATVDAAGNWSAHIGLRPDDTYQIAVTVTDAVGNVGTAAQTLAIDIVDPVVSIDGGAAVTTADASPTITGDSDTATGSIVVLDIDGQGYTALVQADGSWNFTVALADGDHTVTVTVNDAAGNTGTAVQTLTVDTTPPVVTIDGGAAHTTNDATPTISGTATAPDASSVTVTVASQTLSATVTAGMWSATAATLTDTTHAVAVSVTDQVGNVGSAAQTLTVDTTSPTIGFTGGGDTVVTSDAAPTITGVTGAAPGATVTVTAAAQTRTTLVQPDGTWNVTRAAVADGTYTVVASVPDPVGNVGSATQTLTVDTTAPAVTVDGGAARSTSDPSPTITGSGGAAGSAVSISVAGQTLTTVVQPNSAWSVTAAAIPNGTYTVAVTVTDAAGNTGTATQALTVATTPDQPPTQPPTQPSAGLAGRVRLTPIAPVRLADTRSGPSGRLSAGGVLRVVVAGSPGVPADVTAAALNITAVGADAAGFLTVYPCSSTPPTTSTVNFGAGRDTANSTIATLADDGAVCVYSSAGVHLIVDITAWFSANAANAMTATTPRRVADTRVAGRVAAGDVLTVTTGAADAAAVALNVTAVGADEPGYLTVFPCGTTPPDTSTVNFGAHEARPNNTVVATGAGGQVCVFASADVDVIVDVTGVFSPAGLLEYQPSAPQRLLDTRSTGAVAGGGQVAFDVGSTLASAVSVNVTVTGHTADGFATTFACGSPVPETSTLNQRAGEDNANGAIVPVGAGTAGCVFTSSTTNIVVDLNGWWIQRT